MPKPPKPLTLTLAIKRSGNGQFYFEVSPEIAKRFETDPKTRRIVCTLNGTHAFQCALTPNHGVFVIGVNKPTRTKLGLEEGDKVSVRIEQDTSKYGAPMPVEFEEVLRQDPEGDRLFHALTGGMQRSLLFYLGTIKDIDRRIHLGLIILEHLKENNGKVIGERLHDEAKRPIF